MEQTMLNFKEIFAKCFREFMEYPVGDNLATKISRFLEIFVEFMGNS